MPWVKKEPSGGSERDVDHMLTILDRRLRKSGRLDEYRERQYYTKPSEERRQARQEREYKLQKLKERGNANTDSRS
jgi:ribosomal protein S21